MPDYSAAIAKATTERRICDVSEIREVQERGSMTSRPVTDPETLCELNGYLLKGAERYLKQFRGKKDEYDLGERNAESGRSG